MHYISLEVLGAKPAFVAARSGNEFFLMVAMCVPAIE